MKEDIRTVEKTMVKLVDLHYQYIHNYTPTALWNNDMSLPNSPHVELLKTIQDRGFDWKVLWNTRYVAERINRRMLGMSQWTDEHIRDHIKTRWETLKSLKKNGYKSKLHVTKKGKNYPVRVLKEPFWNTRFGINLEWLNGMEIWDGGGRSSAAYALGWETIPAELCEDTMPGTKDKGRFRDKLGKIDGIWRDIE